MTNKEPSPKRRWLSRTVERLVRAPRSLFSSGRVLAEPASDRLLEFGLTGLATILKRPNPPEPGDESAVLGRFVVLVATGDRPDYECTVVQAFTQAEWARLRIGATVDCRIDPNKATQVLLVIPGREGSKAVPRQRIGPSPRRPELPAAPAPVSPAPPTSVGSSASSGSRGRPRAIESTPVDNSGDQLDGLDWAGDLDAYAEDDAGSGMSFHHPKQHARKKKTTAKVIVLADRGKAIAPAPRSADSDRDTEIRDAEIIEPAAADTPIAVRTADSDTDTDTAAASDIDTAAEGTAATAGTDRRSGAERPAGGDRPGSAAPHGGVDRAGVAAGPSPSDAVAPDKAVGRATVASAMAAPAETTGQDESAAPRDTAIGPGPGPIGRPPAEAPAASSTPLPGAPPSLPTRTPAATSPLSPAASAGPPSPSPSPSPLPLPRRPVGSDPSAPAFHGPEASGTGAEAAQAGTVYGTQRAPRPSTGWFDAPEPADASDEPPPPPAEGVASRIDALPPVVEGNRAVGRVIGAEPTNIKTLGTTDPIYVLTLELRSDAEPKPWQVTFGQRIPEGSESHVAPGRTLQVAYRRHGENDGVAVDWHATLNSQESA